MIDKALQVCDYGNDIFQEIEATPLCCPPTCDAHCETYPPEKSSLMIQYIILASENLPAFSSNPQKLKPAQYIFRGPTGHACLTDVHASALLSDDCDPFFIFEDDNNEVYSISYR